MTPADTARVLALVQTYDNRKVDAIVVGAWHALLEPLTFDDACAAVREHYTTRRDWLMPLDILDGVKSLRRRRLDNVELQVPDANPDDTAAYLQAVKDRNMRAADGLQPRDLPPLDRTFPSPPAQPRPLAITSGPARTPVTDLPVVDPDRMAQARAELDELREREGSTT